MTQYILTGEHKRKKTLIFDPTEIETDEHGEIVVRKKRVAAYARVSTELDAQQNSYDAQISFYTNHIRNNPDWEFVRIYADEGISGTSYRRREGFNQMVADAKAGQIDLILTKSISRFARNTVDSLTITRELRAHNVEVFFEKENISSMDAQAELVFTIMSSIAQEESRSISENVRWGIQRSMEAGRVSLPWKSFLGFERGPDGLPQICEEEAKIVRKIYHAYLSGDSLRQICHRLDAAGVTPPRHGKKWYPEAVRNILTNEKYKGDAILQKTYTVDFLSKEKRVNRGERRQWYIQDSHDAIVTAEALKRAQKELNRRGIYNSRYFNSPFTSKIYCGKCGGFFCYRYWDVDKENVVDAWLCKDCHKKDPQRTAIRIKDRKLRKAFLMALSRIENDYEWKPEDFLKDISPALNKEISLDGITPFMRNFNEHAWHTLVEYTKIMPNRSIVFKFRNGRKETIEEGVSE